MRILFILLAGLTASCTYFGDSVNERLTARDMGEGIPNKFDLKNGTKFNHKLHYQDMGFPCVRCHGKENPNGGAIKGFGAAYVCGNCLGCHKNTKYAPTTCDSCHTMRNLPKGFNTSG